MSQWTHIVAVLDVDTGHQMQTDKDVDVIRKALEAAPKITGGERPADVFVNLLSGFNGVTFDDDSNPIHHQSRVVITIIGNLRDRSREQTEKEWQAFKDFIGWENDYKRKKNSLNYYIRNYDCSIIDN